MELNQKMDGTRGLGRRILGGNGLEATFWKVTHLILTGVVEEKYTTRESSDLR
jgi:hypothetical protein